ncbi:hypothetical protein CA850_16290 [Micromonospora echinospora]|nr:hypothetical protein CA850_16290 [Micromonospora echinospora]
MIAVAACTVGAFSIFCAGLWSYANHDRPELIDNPPVRETAESACATMQAAVVAKAVPPSAALDVRIRAVREQNAAVAAMVAQVRSLGSSRLDDDRPTAAWLADWETLVETRDQYANDLSAGRRPHFLVPTVDGVPIIERMNDVDLVCEVPPQLVDLR